MPAAPTEKVYGATVRPITGGPLPPCCGDACPSEARWVVREEQGDDDYVWYSCDECLSVTCEEMLEYVAASEGAMS